MNRCPAGWRACNKSGHDNTGEGFSDGTNPPLYAGFAKGTDISWLTEMEASGKLFYNNSGTKKECIRLMKNLSTDAIRLRVADVFAKVIRARNLGIRVMVDFHYTDFWADPGQQNKSAAWMTLNRVNLHNTCTTIPLLFKQHSRPPV